jgi:hypothetical protein
MQLSSQVASARHEQCTKQRMEPVTDHVTRAGAGAILNDVESLRSFNGTGISTTFGVNRGSRLSSLSQC